MTPFEQACFDAITNEKPMLVVRPKGVPLRRGSMAQMLVQSGQARERELDGTIQGRRAHFVIVDEMP